MQIQKPAWILWREMLALLTLHHIFFGCHLHQSETCKSLQLICFRHVSLRIPAIPPWRDTEVAKAKHDLIARRTLTARLLQRARLLGSTFAGMIVHAAARKHNPAAGANPVNDCTSQCPDCKRVGGGSDDECQSERMLAMALCPLKAHEP